MVKNLLVELGLEEMPAYVVTPSMKQLRDKMGAFLTDHRLTFEKIEMFSTPRRLAVRVVGLADKLGLICQDLLDQLCLVPNNSNSLLRLNRTDTAENVL